MGLPNFKGRESGLPEFESKWKPWLQALQVRLSKWPSFTGMEHGAPHARAVHMATGLVREVAGCENW